ADHADDLRGSLPLPDLAADRALVREEALLDRIADDHDRRAGHLIAPVEQAAGDERDAERLEVTARGGLPPHLPRPLARRHRLVRALEWDRPVVAGERNDDGSADFLDTWDGTQRRERAPVEPVARDAVSISIGGERDADGHHTVSAEAWIDGEQPRDR